MGWENYINLNIYRHRKAKCSSMHVPPVTLFPVFGELAVSFEMENNTIEIKIIQLLKMVISYLFLFGPSTTTARSTDGAEEVDREGGKEAGAKPI